MFARLIRRGRKANVGRVYGAIVAQARAAAFYADYGVPDTVEGRFEMLALHVHLVVRRLNGADAGARDLVRALLERFFADLDANLRELGVGDLAVPRQMRGFAQAFYGRVERYDAALEKQDEAALAAALLRNVFGARGVERAERLARYVRHADMSLAGCTAEQVAAGELALPRPEDS
jgi:cytochrome b pre-mRNA-processing protein 3